ncbi:hypothetical protein [Streptomyces violens]|uniref:hypothetical protein n=1 Tax=Streptomyces violens TaxID=66377 RepID=UPI0004C062B2|nr:hypothetical protein [Streptomyces violens]
MTSTLAKRWRGALVLTAAAVASVPVLTGTAAAAPGDMNAPYARAAAKVAANGAVLASKNVASVTRPRAGAYCVKVSDPAIDLANAAITASINGGAYARTISATGDPTGECGNDPSTITVYTFYISANLSDAPFTVAVL